MRLVPSQQQPLALPNRQPVNSQRRVCNHADHHHSRGGMQTVQSHTLTLPAARLHALAGRQAGSHTPTNLLLPRCMASCTNAGRAEPHSEPSAVPLHGLPALAGRHAGTLPPTFAAPLHGLLHSLGGMHSSAVGSPPLSSGRDKGWTVCSGALLLHCMSRVL